MENIKVTRTTYMVEGMNEPCIEVSDGFTMVRISKCYHYIGKDALYLTEYFDGDFNNKEEWKGDFDRLTDGEAVSLAKRFSIYIS